MDLLANFDAVPLASELPPGAVVLSLQGTERGDLKRAVMFWGAILLGTGLVIGYYVGKRSAK